MIPKIIHYCWLSDDPIPEDLQNWMKTWKVILPDYEFKLWNFEVFDKKSSKWVSEAFDNKKYAFAADYIRLYALYNFGGIYMDMDIQVLKSFNPLLNSSIMIAYENEDCSGLEAGCFGAEKRNPIIKECLDYYQNRSFIKQDGIFDILPLPKIMYSFFSKHPEIEPYSMDYFTCKSYKTGEIKTTNNSFAIHNFAGSWSSEVRKAFDKTRYKIYSKYPQKLAKVIVLFPLIYCIIKEGGVKKLIKVVLKKE